MSTFYGINSQMAGTLFSTNNSNSLGTNTVGTGSSIIADYSNIKNGSYKKLLNAYYKKYGNTISETGSNSTSADTTKDIKEIMDSSKKLEESASALLEKGKDSVFNKKSLKEGDTKKEYDTDEIYKSVQSFVKNYNDLVKKAGDSNTESVLRNEANLVKYTSANEKLLSKIGIGINSDNTLSISEDTFKKSDMNTVKSIFNDAGSYGYRAKSYATQINYNSKIESNKSNTYTLNGDYSSTYSMGNIYNSLF